MFLFTNFVFMNEKWVVVSESVFTRIWPRIKKCVYEALAKDPPEWAKNILEHSTSKEVYKGNASGPTKVLFVLFFLVGNLYGSVFFSAPSIIEWKLQL